MLLYPRKDNVGKLVHRDQMVTTEEHLLSNHRVLSVAGEIGDSAVPCDWLLALDSVSHEPIKMIINSSGGNLDTTFMMYDTIKSLKSPVYTLGRICYSAAVILLVAGQKRFVMPHSRTMLHLPQCGFSGNSEELRIQQEEMEKYKEAMLNILQECGAKKTTKQILKDINNQDFWMGAEQSIEYGLADEVISPDTLASWTRASWTSTT